VKELPSPSTRSLQGTDVKVGDLLALGNVDVGATFGNKVVLYDVSEVALHM
jgi:hypothetical protein